MEDVDLRPTTGDPLVQNRKLVELIRETIATLDGWSKSDYPTADWALSDLANYLESEVSIIVT